MPFTEDQQAEINALIAAATAAATAASSPVTTVSASMVNAVSLKLPPFWTEEPTTWFHQVQAQFDLRHITADSTRYNYVIAALDSSTAKRVAHAINNPPTDNKFQTIRAELCQLFERTQASKDHELFTLAGLGDRRPSAMLRHIKNLNSDPATLLRALLLQQLPSDVRAVMAGSSFETTEALAKTADRIMEERALGRSPASVHALAANPPVSIDVGTFTAPVATAVSPRPPWTPSQPRKSLVEGICFFHRKFGMAARSCKSGCKFANLPTAPPPSPTSGNANAGR